MEIANTTPHGREVDRLSIPEWFEKRGISACRRKFFARPTWASTGSNRPTERDQFVAHEGNERAR